MADPDFLARYVTNKGFLIASILLQFISTFALMGVQWDAIWEMTRLTANYTENLRIYEKAVAMKLANQTDAVTPKPNFKCPRLRNPNDTKAALRIDYGDKHVSFEFYPSHPQEVITFIRIQCSGFLFCFVHGILLCVLLEILVSGRSPDREKPNSFDSKIWYGCTSYLKIVTVVSLVVIVTKPAKQSILVDFWEEFIILNEIILVLTKATYQELEAKQDHGGVGPQVGSSNATHPPHHKLWISLNNCWLFSFVIVEAIAAILWRINRALIPNYVLTDETPAYEICGIPVIVVMSVVHVVVLLFPVMACWFKNNKLTDPLLIGWTIYLIATALGAVVFFIVIMTCNLIGMTNFPKNILKHLQLHVHEMHQNDVNWRIVIIVTNFCIKFVFINGILLLLTKSYIQESHISGTAERPVGGSGSLR